jgi:cobalt-zinc-cadmium efflux system protein
MLVVAVTGLGVNLVAAWLLARGDRHNVNTRAALAHVASDALGSVAAIVAALCVLLFGWQRADIVASLAIALLILAAAFQLVTQTVSVLMESAPPGVELEALQRTILETPGVTALHDLHAWRISEGFDVVTVHVVLDGVAHGTDVAQRVGERVHAAHGVEHVTVQPEAPIPDALHPPERLVRKEKA